MRPARLLGLLALSFSALLSACGHGTPAANPHTLTLRRGLSGEPSTLDPAQVADTFSAEVVRDIYEGLTAEAPDGSVIPAMAQTWDVDPGGTHYIFHLRANLTWSDGTPLTAEDFVNAWRRVVDPKQAAADADLLRIIKNAAAITASRAPLASLGARAVDQHTLDVTLEQPAPYFPALLSHPAAYPVRSDAMARSHDPKAFVSNGPFVLAAWLPGTEVKLAKNSRYWDQSHVRTDVVEYLFNADDSAQLRRYLAGELDLTDNVPSSDVPRLQADHARELKIAPFIATAYYGINLTQSPLGKDLKLRQALAMAIDRKRVVQELALGQTPAFGFVAPGTLNYTPQSWNWRDLSDQARIEKARSLYEAAGFSPKRPLRLRLLYNTNPGIRNTAIAVASMWQEVLGIETALEDEEYRVFLDTRHDKTKWQIARFSWGADYNDAGNFLDTLRTNSANNDQGYANPAYDALLDEAAVSPDSGVRREKLQAAERLMLEDYPIIPLYHFVSKRLVKPYVQGVDAPNALNHFNSKWLSLPPKPRP